MEHTRTFTCAHVNLSLDDKRLYLNGILIAQYVGASAAFDKFERLSDAIALANIVPDETGDDTPCP